MPTKPKPPRVLPFVLAAFLSKPRPSSFRPPGPARLSWRGTTVPAGRAVRAAAAGWLRGSGAWLSEPGPEKLGLAGGRQGVGNLSGPGGGQRVGDQAAPAREGGGPFQDVGGARPAGKDRADLRWRGRLEAELGGAALEGDQVDELVGVVEGLPEHRPAVDLHEPVVVAGVLDGEEAPVGHPFHVERPAAAAADDVGDAVGDAAVVIVGVARDDHVDVAGGQERGSSATASPPSEYSVALLPGLGIVVALAYSGQVRPPSLE